METKASPLLDLSIEDERTVKSIFAVFGNRDMTGDIIRPGAFRKTIRERLPTGDIKVLWQHDPSEPPIGVPLELREVGRDELSAEVRRRFPDASGGLFGAWRALETPRGDEVLAGIRAGAITQNSIGFDALKWDLSRDEADDGETREIKEIRLWDISPVNWGANPATHNLKAAIPFRATETAPMDAPWDGSAAVAAAPNDAAVLRRMHAWVDPEGDPDAKSSYKLPHHRPDGTVVWRGVAAAMAALLGARGGVAIPDADRRGVYDHLAGHYRQFDQEPPDFKLLELAATVHTIGPESLRAGRVLSAANLERLKAALATLTEILLAAEPPAEDESAKALTVEALLRRVAIAEREIALY